MRLSNAVPRLRTASLTKSRLVLVAHVAKPNSRCRNRGWLAAARPPSLLPLEYHITEQLSTAPKLWQLVPMPTGASAAMRVYVFALSAAPALLLALTAAEISEDVVPLLPPESLSMASSAVGITSSSLFRYCSGIYVRGAIPHHKRRKHAWRRRRWSHFVSCFFSCCCVNASTCRFPTRYTTWQQGVLNMTLACSSTLQRHSSLSLPGQQAPAKPKLAETMKKKNTVVVHHPTLCALLPAHSSGGLDTHKQINESSPHPVELT